MLSRQLVSDVGLIFPALPTPLSTIVMIPANYASNNSCDGGDCGDVCETEPGCLLDIW
jgi:hypothetical protein